MYKQLVLGAAVAVLSLQCGARDLCTFSDTGQLSADLKFKPAIKKFLGSHTFKAGVYTVRVVDRALLNFSGPPGDIKSLPDALFLATACRARDCGDKVAVVLACPSKIVAVGVVDYNDEPLLEVYSTNRAAPLVAAFDQWKLERERESNRPLKLAWHTLPGR